MIGVDRGAGVEALTAAGANLVVQTSASWWPEKEQAHERTRGPSHKAPPVADPLDRTRFPVDEWRLVETRFDASDLGTTESLFTVGNGYLGLRGNYSESRDAHLDGTFINGFHETWPISHAEEAYGFARIGQTIVNVPDPKVIRLYVDDEPLQVSVADLIEYERALDFRTGVLTRDLVWRTPGGKRVRMREHPDGAASTQRHLAVLTLRGHPPRRARVAGPSARQLINRQDQEQRGSGGSRRAAAASQAPTRRKAEMFERRVLEPRLHGADAETGRIKLGYRTDRERA